MQVKQRLRINWMVPAVSVLAVIVILSVAVVRVQRALDTTAIADALLTASFERLILRTDLMRTGNERSKEQWAAKQAQIGALLTRALDVFQGAQDRATVHDLIETHQAIGKLSSTIDANRARSGGPPRDVLSQQMEARLLSQLNMKVYETILLNRKLEVSGHQAVSSSLIAAASGIVLMLLVISTVTLINSVTMNRTISAQIGRLRKGAAVIGGGNLEHRIATTGDDEFVELAQAFNEMTARLQSSYQSLEGEIEERKQAEEGLRQAREAAEAASRTKSQFLANMSHELRTPMTGVLGMLQLTLESPLEGEQREYLEAALKAGHSLLRIINDILDLTKVESGKLVLQSKPFVLRKCVSETAAMLIPEAHRKGLKLKLALSDDLPAKVEGDQVRLRQILANLTANAVKFTDQGEVEVKAVVESRSPEGVVEILFSVSDTGIGIPEEKKHLLFNYFSQVDDSNTRGYGGTGLGLAISKMLVEGMGGTIGFQSEEGKGSTFCFTIPFRLSAEVVEEAVNAPQIAAPQERKRAIPCGERLAVRRLLIAEDDPTIRQLLGGLLARMNFETEFAENGEKAVAMWQENEFDLILMDVQMPKLDGFDATRAIRKREREQNEGRHIPIIAMTAHAMKEDEDRCLAAGMDRYIAKPIDFKTCLEIIDELVPPTGKR